MKASTPSQQRLPFIGKAIRVFWVLAALESAGTLVFLALIPGDVKNALVLGFSGSRLAIMAVIAAVLAASLAALSRGEPVSGKILSAPLGVQRKVFALFILLAVAGWQLSFLADYQLGQYLAYYQRLQPLLILTTFLLLQSACLLAAGRALLPDGQGQLSFSPGFRKTFAITAVGFLVFWLIVLTTGLGIGAGNNYWNKVGVPLLGVQIIAAAGFGLLVFFIERHSRLERILTDKPWLVDLALVSLIWIGAALCWGNIPAAASRFNTQPLPPNFTSYPFSDAQEYALSAERILQGKNIAYNYVDKPLHLVFLVLIRLLGGMNYDRVILWQTILLASMPALIYLLGKSLLNRAAGMMAAVLAVFYQINSIQSTNLIQVSNVKMMLSEPLTAAAMISLCLLAARWLKSSSRWWENLMLLSGMVGIASLIRLNAASFGLVLLLAAAVKLKWNWKRVLRAAAVAAVFFSIALTPWVVRNSVVADSPVMFLKNKIHGVIWRKRLSPILQTNQSTPSPAAAPSATGAAPVPDTADGIEDEEDGMTTLLRSFGANYAHNLVSTFLMVPPVLQQGDILHIVREPYWDNEWDGTFTRGGVALLILNLSVVSAGVAAAWSRRRMAGMIPLFALLAYHLTNAVSVVSGGRYIVPVDWVIYFYFALGLGEGFHRLMKLFEVNVQEPEPVMDLEPPAFPFRLKGILPIAAILLLAGGIPWAVEEAFPEKYPLRSPAQVKSDFDRVVDWESIGVSATDVNAFLQNPEAILLEGQAFFPRFFQPGEGDTAGSGSVFGVKDYPHFGFVLMGQSRNDINLYLEEIPHAFPDGSDVIILGCRGIESNDALLVVAKSEGVTYARPDLIELKCPLGGPD